MKKHADRNLIVEWFCYYTIKVGHSNVFEYQLQQEDVSLTHGRSLELMW